MSGAADATIGSPSQEHLGIRFPDETSRPAVGDLLTLVPRHVDTTVAQFDWFLLIRAGAEPVVHPVSARHHPRPLR